MSVSSIGASGTQYTERNSEVGSGNRAGRMGQPPSPEKMASFITNDLTSQLSLTEEQQSLLKDIVAKYTSQMSGDTSQTNSSAKPDFSQMESLRSQMDSEIEKILTSDQLSKFESLQTERSSHANMQGPPNGMNGSMNSSFMPGNTNNIQSQLQTGRSFSVYI
ncbi:MAG: hypothetical protein QG635_1780 [Bacteroidota bacterium]|nr:hypothetical protein [Bacteroidota bacterium]